MICKATIKEEDNNKKKYTLVPLNWIGKNSTITISASIPEEIPTELFYPNINNK